MTWTGKTFNVGDILTAAQMNNLQADITAQANGDAGAPPQLWDSMINSASAEGSASIDATGSGHLFTPGVYQISGTAGTDLGGGTSLQIDVKINGTFQTMDRSTSSGDKVGGMFFCINSGDLRILAGTVTGNAHWHKLA